MTILTFTGISSWQTALDPAVLSRLRHPSTPTAPPPALVEHKVQGQFLPPAVMPPCLWLIWVSGLTELSPKEWALVVTYEEDVEAFGTLYKVRSAATSCRRSPHSQRFGFHTSSRTLAQG